MYVAQVPDSSFGDVARMANTSFAMGQDLECQVLATAGATIQIRIIEFFHMTWNLCDVYYPTLQVFFQ